MSWFDQRPDDAMAGAFEELASPDRHAKILVEPWRS